MESNNNSPRRLHKRCTSLHHQSPVSCACIALQSLALGTGLEAAPDLQAAVSCEPVASDRPLPLRQGRAQRREPHLSQSAHSSLLCADVQDRWHDGAWQTFRTWIVHGPLQLAGGTERWQWPCHWLWTLALTGARAMSQAQQVSHSMTDCACDILVNGGHWRRLQAWTQLLRLSQELHPRGDSDPVSPGV